LIYRKSKTFQDHFEVSIEEQHFFIETSSGKKSWAWREFNRYYETHWIFSFVF